MDPLLIGIQIMLGSLGILGVAVHSPEFVAAHTLRLVLALFITAAVSHLPPKWIVKASPYLYGAVMAMLVMVLFVGDAASGESRRWLLVGGFAIQPSELMKLAVIAYLTAFFYNHLGNWQIWRPMVVIGAAAGLVVAEPDVSTSLFLFALAFAIMFAAGTSVTRLLSISSAAAMIAILVAGPYLQQFGYIGERITGFQDMLGSQTMTEDVSYQATQARSALVKAGLFGVGPGRPVHVPEAHTDLIAIAIGQTSGLLGIAILVTLFLILAGRGLRIASARSGPGSLLAAGATTYICGQAALNLLVASGMVPITGIPLPFVSHGFNSLISIAIAMGFIHVNYRQARREGIEL